MPQAVGLPAQAEPSGRTWLVAACVAVFALSALGLGVIVGLMLAESPAPVAVLAAGTDPAIEAGPPAVDEAEPARIPEPAPLVVTEMEPEQVMTLPQPVAATTPDPVAPASGPAEPAPGPAEPSAVAAGAPEDDPRAALALEAMRPKGFVVQAGSFLDPDNAARLAERIGAVAAPARVTPFEDAGGRRWSVVSVGPFPDSATASEAAVAISRAFGLDPILRPAEAER